MRYSSSFPPRLFVLAVSITGLFIGQVASAVFPIAKEAKVKQLTLYKQESEDKLSSIGKPVNENDRITTLLEQLANEAMQLPLGSSPASEALCYVLFDQREDGECSIARVQVDRGVFLMLKGKRQGESVEIDWEGSATLWKCDAFTKEVLKQLKETAPEYLADLDSRSLKFTRRTIEDRLKIPVVEPKK